MSDRPRPLTAGNVGWKLEDLLAAAGSERGPYRLRIGIDDVVFTSLDSGYLASPISSSLRNAAPAAASTCQTHHVAPSSSGVSASTNSRHRCADLPHSSVLYEL
jgi:hypothetical protein